MSERIIDACCLINLYASGEEESILRACGGFWIPAQVRSEALRIRRVDEDDPTRLVPQEIDLGGAIKAGYIRQCQLQGQEELDAFVRFAMQLDDGEASCLAVAESRGWSVATDDRKARRIASENGIPLTSTPELVRRWIDATSPDHAAITELLRRIERFARFCPRRADPLHGWWVAFGGKDDA